jgi:predicted RNase H-like HicB family nuclease
VKEEMLIKFEVYNDGEYWCARGIGVDIFTQGKTLDELTKNMKEAVEAHFEDLLESGEEIKVLSISEFEVHPVAEATSS